MKYKFFVFCPDDEKVINAVIDAAASNGAGVIGDYTKCAFIIPGRGNFVPKPGADPTIGEVGKETRVQEMKIEMECPADKAKAVKEAIIKVHPYEEVAIDFIKLEDM